jgi:hypothetical protein
MEVVHHRILPSTNLLARLATKFRMAPSWQDIWLSIAFLLQETTNTHQMKPKPMEKLPPSVQVDTFISAVL